MERVELDATQATTPINKTTIQAARSQWFKVVSLVLSNLEVSRAPARDIEIIRWPVLRASDRAGQRYALFGQGVERVGGQAGRAHRRAV